MNVGRQARRNIQCFWRTGVRVTSILHLFILQGRRTC